MDLLRLADFYIRDLDAETLDFYIIPVYLIRVVKGATPTPYEEDPKAHDVSCTTRHSYESGRTAHQRKRLHLRLLWFSSLMIERGAV